ncbi:MAG TPA: hypothetical protein VGR26_05010 [Acidimicrobiales bacterium]|nr:hypothetical protein [Acidimicrobiales bacterium]
MNAIPRLNLVILIGAGIIGLVAREFEAAAIVLGLAVVLGVFIMVTDRRDRARRNR